jgi:hypothetical protein
MADVISGDERHALALADPLSIASSCAVGRDRRGPVPTMPRSDKHRRPLRIRPSGEPPTLDSHRPSHRRRIGTLPRPDCRFARRARCEIGHLCVSRRDLTRTGRLPITRPTSTKRRFSPSSLVEGKGTLAGVEDCNGGRFRVRQRPQLLWDCERNGPTARCGGGGVAGPFRNEPAHPRARRNVPASLPGETTTATRRLRICELCALALRRFPPRRNCRSALGFSYGPATRRMG